MLKSVVHGCGRESAIRILRNCRAAMSPRAKLLLIERNLYRRPDEAFPAAAEAERRTLALPLYPGLGDDEQARVVEALREAGP